MAIEIRMPRLGWTMEEGIFGEWLKEDSSTIAPGDLLFTVESDKATQEVEAFDSGVLRIPPDGPQPGQVIEVGALMAYIVEPGETAPFETDLVSAPAPSFAPHAASENVLQPEIPSRAASSGGVSTRGEPAISPRARRIATELDVAWMDLVGSGRTGRIVERDVRAAHAAMQNASHPNLEKVRITPVAERMAREAGIDLVELADQHPGTRIKRDHVEAAIEARTSAAPAHASRATESSDMDSRDTEGTQRVPVTRMRNVIAQRMVESVQTTASVTLTSEADATNLVALRAQLKQALAPRAQTVPAYNDLLIKITALALQEHPLLNATWQGNEIVLHDAVHLGLAVDVEKGLLVPVVRNAQAKSVGQIAEDTRALIARAQANQLGPDELAGGTFTLTNLGMFGIDFFTPLINLPQCAILGVGRITERPAIYEGQVAPRHLMALSLTFDHRVVDGAPAARFLNTVREWIETPALWLVK